MNIVIFDNQPDYQSHVEKKIHECFHERYVRVHVYKYSKLTELLQSVRKHSYQFAFIEMRAENHRGIEVAKLLQRFNPACQVIFMSNRYLRVPEAFQINAMDYILKPINTEQFGDTLDNAMEWYKKQNIRFVIPIRSLSQKKLFHVDDISYFTTYYNDLEIVTVDGKHFIAHVKVRNQLREALGPRWFIQINESTLINMKQIAYLDEKDAVLHSNERFTISKVKHKQHRLKYAKFLKEMREKTKNENH